MATYTPNLNLKKPIGAESFNIGDHNGNMDKIDTLAVLSGTTAPTTSTVGALKQFYVQKLADGTLLGLFMCTLINGSVYTWSPTSIGELIGSIKNYMGTSYSVPGQTWALANGAEFSATTYPGLATLLGKSNPGVINWNATNIISGVSHVFISVKYITELGKYFAIGYPEAGGTTLCVYYTDDLVTGTWTSIALTPGVMYYPNDLIYYKGNLIILGLNASNAVQIWYSTTGTSGWALSAQAVNGVQASSVNMQLATDGIYLVAYTAAATNNYGYCTAVNGAWTSVSHNAGLIIGCMAYDTDNSRWCLITSTSSGGTCTCNSYYASNPTSVSWTSFGLIATFPTGQHIARIRKLNGLWVIFSYYSSVYVAYGASLTASMTVTARSTTNNIYDIGYANGYYVCACGSGYVSAFTSFTAACFQKTPNPSYVYNITVVAQEQEAHGGLTVLFGTNMRYSLPRYTLPISTPTVGNNFIRML